ncbi:MAG: flippase-like domain-containing protein [Deltaproteobacteria bacterium]|nr:flippase-like domain-containing protein [Deltaproteobacteria bacterium]
MPSVPAGKSWSTALSWVWRLLGVAVAIGCVVFLWRYPWGASLRAMGAANLAWVGAALLARACAVAARAERSYAMLGAQTSAGRVMFARYTLCRLASDNLLAAWSGIGVFTWLLVRHGGARVSSVAGALVLEKSLDIAAVACGLGAVVHWRLLPLGWSEPGFMTTLGLGIAVLVAAIAWGRLAPQSRIGRAVQPAAVAFGPALQGLRVVVLTLVVWTCEGLVLAFSMRATGLHLEPLQVVMFTVVAVMAFLVPGVPSGAGTVEAGIAAGMKVIGVDEVQALTAALVYHAVQVVPETMAGLLAMRGLGVGLRRRDA